MATKAAHQQEGESAQAFEAFVCYLKMGPRRSIAAVAKKLNKSHALISRWSSKWEWGERTRKVNNARISKVEEKVEKKLQSITVTDIMSETELPVRLSMLARADISTLYNDKGEIDIAALKENGLGFLLNSVTTTETRYPNGTVRISRKVSIEGRKGFMELIGRHLGTWDMEGVKDPEALLLAYVEALKGQKHRLPPAT